MAIDNNDNILISGEHTNTLSVGGITVASDQAGNGFTAKINKNGGVDWLKYTKCSGTFRQNGLCIDDNGNTYTYGSFSQSLTVSGTSLTSTFPLSSLYIIKYSPSGALVWAKKMATGVLSAGAIKFGEGNMYIGGKVQNITSNPFLVIGTFTLANSTPTANTTDFFVAKLDTSGAVLSASLFGSAANEQLNDLTFSPDGGLVVSGTFNSQLLSLGSYTLSTPSQSVTYSFLVKLNSAGTVLWAKKFNTVNLNVVVSTDPWNNVYLASLFAAPGITVDNLSLNTAGLTKNAALIKFDPSGNALWAKVLGGSGCNSSSIDAIISLGNDKAGGVNAIGYYESPTLVIGTNTLTNNSTICGRRRLVVLQYDAAGSLRGVLDGGAQNMDMYGMRVATDSHYNLVISGSYNGTQVGLGPLSLYGNAPFTQYYYRLYVAKARSLSIGLNEIGTSSQLLTWPVPSTSNVSFKNENSPIEHIGLYDLHGKLVLTQNASAHLVELQISSLTPGIYFARVKTEDKQLFTTKIIKEE